LKLGTLDSDKEMLNFVAPHLTRSDLLDLYGSKRSTQRRVAGGTVRNKDPTTRPFGNAARPFADRSGRNNSRLSASTRPAGRRLNRENAATRARSALNAFP